MTATLGDDLMILYDEMILDDCYMEVVLSSPPVVVVVVVVGVGERYLRVGRELDDVDVLAHLV